MLSHGQITDAETYLGNNELIGICDEFNVPELENKVIEHETLGSIGVLTLPARGLAALSGDIKMSFPEPEFMAITSNPRKAQLLQLHSKLDVFDGDGLNEEKSTTLITLATVLFKKRAFPSSKKSENEQYTAEFTVNRLVQRDIRSDTPIVEIDFFKRIHRVNGQDVWPS